MQPFSPLRGRWWVPGNEKAHVPCELSFTREGGARLSLDGDLEGTEPVRFFPGKPFPLVHGRSADDTLVTLTGVAETNGGFRRYGGGPPIETTVYRPDVVYLGDHCLAEPTFAYARVEFTHLDKWLGNLAVLPNHHFGPSGMLDKYSVTCEWPDPVEIGTPDGLVRIQGAYDIDQTGNERVTLRTAGYVEWMLEGARDFRGVLRPVMILQTLLALLMDYPVVAEQITFRPEHNTGKEVRVFFQAVYESPEREPFNERDMLLKRDQISIPLEELVPRWQGVRDQFETSSNILSSLRYTPAAVTDLQFISMVQASEAFHAAGSSNEVLPRGDFDAKKAAVKAALTDEQWKWIAPRISNEPSLKMRLVALMTDVAEIVEPVALNGIDKCASRIRDLRNDMTHPRHDRDAGGDGLQYLYYARLMSFTLTTALLKALGLLDGDLMARLQRSRQSSRVATLGSQLPKSE